MSFQSHTRSALDPIITREFELCVRDFKKTPSALCWVKLEQAMFAFQWVKTRRDVEIEALADKLFKGIALENYNPSAICSKVAEELQVRAAEEFEETVRQSIRKPMHGARLTKGG
jgi:hypothetical protein